MTQAYDRVLLTLQVFFDKIRLMAYGRQVIQLLTIAIKAWAAMHRPQRGIPSTENKRLPVNSTFLY